MHQCSPYVFSNPSTIPISYFTRSPRRENVSNFNVHIQNLTGQSTGPEPGAGCDFTPHPDYWVALLWRRLMGRRVLPTPTATYPSMEAENPALSQTLRLHAHCTAGTSNGSVSVVWANMDEAKTYDLDMSKSDLGGIRFQSP